MSEVRRWLESLGLGQYAGAFQENAVEIDQTATLTDVELRELGVTALGHRKRIRDHPPSGLVLSSATPGDYTPAHLAERVLSSRAAMEGERKQITVLFADVVGSTTLIRELDAEGAMERLRPAVEAMMAAVHRQEGLANRVQGDGIMALFGAPIAHEDHGARACLAALEIRDAVRDLADRGLGVRIGLNSGEVIVRAIRNDLTVEYEAEGVTVHYASRMEQLAEPGTVRATETTARLAQGHVEWRSLGTLAVKGAREPVAQVEVQARHAFEGERWSEAVSLLRQAVDRATAQSAHSAASRHLEHALQAIARLPESSEAGTNTVDFHLDLKNVLLALGRLGSIGPHLEEAERIVAALGDPHRHSRVFYHLCQYHWLTGDHQRALEYAERAREIATAAGDAIAEIEIYHRLGALYHSLGDYHRGVEVLRRGEVFIAGRSDTPGLPLVSTRLFLVWCLAELGELDEAVRIAEENYRTARDAGLPWSVVDAVMGLGVAYLAQGKPGAAIEPLELGLAQCREGELPIMTPWIARHLGTAYTRCGRGPKGSRSLSRTLLSRPSWVR